MSRDTAKCASWHVSPSKTQIRLRGYNLRSALFVQYRVRAACSRSFLANRIWVSVVVVLSCEIMLSHIPVPALEKDKKRTAARKCSKSAVIAGRLQSKRANLLYLAAKKGNIAFACEI